MYLLSSSIQCLELERLDPGVSASAMRFYGRAVIANQVSIRLWRVIQLRAVDRESHPTHPTEAEGVTERSDRQASAQLDASWE